MGYSVVSIAKSANDAVKKARLCSPDLLLMDINLGNEKDGIQAVEEIYQETDIPVIYVTAYADDDTINRAKKTHPLGYVKSAIMTLQTSQYVPMVAIAESKFLSLLSKVSLIFLAILDVSTSTQFHP